MISGLERFVAELRREGLSASPAEWLEALRAVERLGLDDRERFRRALRCTLVKRAAQLELFDRVFEGFFAAPGTSGPGSRRSARGAGGSGGRRPIAAGPAPSGTTRKPASAAEPSPARDPTPCSAASALPRAVAALLEGQPWRHGRWRRVLLGPGAPAPRATRAGPSPPAAAAPGADPLRRDLAWRLSPEGERELAALVPRIVERIRLRSGRRLRRSRRGRPYMRRVFRDSLRHGGVPCVLPFRRRRPRRSRIVLLTDVSWSVARAAGLFLSIAGELLRHSRDVRVLLFVDRAVDATREIDDWLRRQPTPRDAWDGGSRGARRPGSGIARGGVSFAKLVSSLPGLAPDAPSDYGRAFHGLARSSKRPGGRTTALVVLGDGRTNRFDPQAWAFEELASRCGAVIWLVPEPWQRWGSGDSALGAYLPHADVAVETSDLAGLARGVAELVRRL